MIFIPETLSVSIARQPFYPATGQNKAQRAEDLIKATVEGQTGDGSPTVMTAAEIVSITAAAVASGAVIAIVGDDDSTAFHPQD